MDKVWVDSKQNSHRLQQHEPRRDRECVCLFLDISQFLGYEGAQNEWS